MRALTASKTDLKGYRSACKETARIYVYMKIYSSSGDRIAARVLFCLVYLVTNQTEINGFPAKFLEREREREKMKMARRIGRSEKANG